MTRIVHVTSAHPTFDIRIFHKECTTLANAGYEVVLIAPYTGDVTVAGVHVKAIAKARNRLQRMFLTTWRAYKAAVAVDGKIYHLHDPELLPFGKLLVWRGKRVIFDMHENVPKQIVSKRWLPAILRRPIAVLYRAAEHFLLAGVEVVFAERSYRKDYTWVKKWTEVLNLSRVSDLTQVAEPKQMVPTLGYIGAVSAERGITTTVEVLRDLHERGWPIAFECVGDMSSEYRQAVVQLAESYGLKDAIRLHGYMQATDGWRVISRCHIGLALLKPIPNYVDSMPTKLFEYMALGLPVVVSDFPLYRNIVSDAGCGLLADPDDTGSIASAVEWLLQHPEEGKEMGRRGRAAAMEHWNWENEKHKLIEFYRR